MNMSKKHIFVVLVSAVLASSVASCSSTRAIPEGEQLFTGLKKIEYTNFEENEHAVKTQQEMEYALASAPNGALFGSSYYRTPFPIRLWIWNAFSQSTSGVGRWLTKAFGSKPKLMSQVNPELRVSVAKSQLKKYGYFYGDVSYKVITGRNPKTAKLAYTVNMGPLWRIDSIEYLRFPPVADSLIRVHRSEAVIKNGDPFSVPALSNERMRLAKLFRNNGYYYYNESYASYLADTISVPRKVLLRFQMADSLEASVKKKWYIGKIDINLRREFTDTLKDSIQRRSVIVHFNGRKTPVRTGVILREMRLRPHQLYSVDNEETSKINLQNVGLFSYSSLRFTPRDSSATADTLDLSLDMVLDKRYDFYVEANAKGKTSGRIGPELVVGFTKKNAFRGGEKVDINLHGSYEWQTGHTAEGTSSGINSYEYGGDAALIIPRILTLRSLFGHTRLKRDTLPRRRNLLSFTTPATTLKASTNTLNRAGYFKRHIVSGELTYDFWTSERSSHTFSPLILSYEYMNSKTVAFEQLMNENPYLKVSMQDQFVPKMSYTYRYTNAAASSNPVSWSITLSEGGNLVSLAYLTGGYKWNNKGKKMFKNPYAQFFKTETDFVKLWRFSEHSTLVGHLNAGIIYAYGNSTQAPYYEQFYVGGANSIRAFNVRSIGPGRYVSRQSRMSYIEQTGDIKILANLEYRPRLFGSLFGALFLDAGNVWTVHEDSGRPDSQFKFRNFMKEMAVGTGVGLRYDMGLFVIRVDWGVGLHVPYDTGKGGFYNIRKFRDGQSIHLAVGYPF